MKSRHCTRQNQTIVNIALYIPTLFRASTLTQPFRTAADNPTANSGRGKMNTRRSNWVRLCSTAILIVFAAGYGTVAADGFKNLKIRDV